MNLNRNAIDALESLQSEISTWRENVMNKRLALSGKPFTLATQEEKALLDGREQAYLWTLEEIEKRVGELYENYDRELEAASQAATAS